MKTYQLTLSIFFSLFTTVAQAQIIEMVKDINPSGNSYPLGFTPSNGKLFFIAGDNVNFNKLYVTQGTAATTQLLGPATGNLNSIYTPVSYNNKIYFSYNDGINGQELWVSDGTVAGTLLFKDLYPGATGSFPQYFTVANNKLFFMGSSPDGDRRLYVSDGTPAGTFVLKNNYIDVLNGQLSFPILNSNIYFRGDNGTGAGYGFWKSDGTPAGTVLVKPDFLPGVSGCNYAVLNNKLYFSGYDNVNGSELWVTDGSGPGTFLVKNIAADQVGILYGGSPQQLTVYNSKIFFSAWDNIHGTELYVTDGTAAGTVLVKDVYPGSFGSNPSEMTVYNGLLYFSLPQLSELWKSDGTTAGTQLVKATIANLRLAANWNNKLYFVSAFDEVWESDGSTAGTKLIMVSNTINPISSYGADSKFTAFNGGVYFSGFCASITPGYEPVRLIAGIPPVSTFTFSGSGNWSNPANWSGGLVPPATLPSGSNIVITGQCILDVAQSIQSGASITVATGASLLILGSLTSF